MTILDRNSKLIDTFCFTKTTEHDMDGWLKSLLTEWNDVTVKGAVEKVRSSPQMGVSSSFTFGWNYGILRMMMVANGIGFIEPTPQVWQKKLAVVPRKKTEKQPQFKARLRGKAQEMWPAYSSKITIYNADSFLIAEYLRLTELGR